MCGERVGVGEEGGETVVCLPSALLCDAMLFIM